MKVNTETDQVIDPCVYCGLSTAFGSGNGLFVNRLPVDDGWGCADCSGFECDECSKQIYLDCEIRVDYEDEDGKWHYGNYHEDCYNPEKHGQAYEWDEN